jgi:hypothetical protein
MASYDRSGRMGYEDFNVAPAIGWADPLHVYCDEHDSGAAS